MHRNINEKMQHNGRDSKKQALLQYFHCGSLQITTMITTASITATTKHVHKERAIKKRIKSEEINNNKEK